MATIYRKTYPIPMPENAEVVQRRGKPTVRWTDKRGRMRTSPVAPDGRRMMYVSEVWYARYKDADGRERRISTGCRDEQAARKRLADLIAELEKVKVGFITPAQIDTAEHGKRPIAEHVDEYLEHLRIKRVRGRRISRHYRRNVKGRLTRLIQECRLARLPDITLDAANRWLDKAENAGLSAATRNEYLASLAAFCNWLTQSGRLAANPLARMQKADRSSDRRHVRRALTAAEVGRLLHAARVRPVAELGRQSVPLDQADRCGRSSWTYEPLTADNLDACHRRALEKLEEKPHRRHKLEAIGLERSLFYLLAVSTGLRRNELASLAIGQLHLDAVPAPYIELRADQTKSGKAANVPLRGDVAEQLRDYVGRFGPEPSLNSPLFTRPPTIRVFDADCQAAGITKTDGRGRVVDIHSLRTTFGTHLAVAGVHPRVAQAAMRHSRMELTNAYYTDPALLDVAGAVNSLPAFDGRNVNRTDNNADVA